MSTTSPRRSATRVPLSERAARNVIRALEETVGSEPSKIAHRLGLTHTKTVRLFALEEPIIMNSKLAANIARLLSPYALTYPNPKKRRAIDAAARSLGIEVYAKATQAHRVAMTLCRIGSRIEQFRPGLHVAPFLDREARPILLSIDASGYLVRSRPVELSDEERAGIPLFPRGVHYAPWRSSAGGGAKHLIALSDGSRLVASMDVPFSQPTIDEHGYAIATAYGDLMAVLSAGEDGDEDESLWDEDDDDSEAWKAGR